MGMSAKKLAIYGNECQTVSTLNERVPTLFHFTRLKSSILMGFSTLPRQSGDVVALYQTKVQQSGRLWHFTRLTRCCAVVVPRCHTRAVHRWQAGSCELDGSCKL